VLVLAGDIGGTKVDVGLSDGGPPGDLARLGSAGYPDLEALLADYLRRRAVTLDAAAFGVAGPVVDGRVATTNLPWVIEQRSLERLLGCPVALLNDLESMAHGVDELSGDEIAAINPGREVPRAPRAIIAAGTGLGEAYMIWDVAAGRYAPHPSEGGHADFAPRRDDEIALLRTLVARHGHVSVERVVSGPGIRSIFEHLEATRVHEVPEALRREIVTRDPTAVIGEAALRGSPPICVEAMRLFVSAYGAEAGNLALKVVALGGVYVGGGIAPRILPLLRDGLFARSFADKGRFREMLEGIPVRVILQERAGLLGAAAAARRLARQGAGGGG
jgi:glucokinase